jgi:dTDP-L-rhamnose 4-epimerase
MVVLVTGGAGFIGSSVVDALVNSGHQVRVIDALLPTGRTPAASGEDHTWTGPPAGEKNRRSRSSAAELDAEFVHADLRDRAAVDAALRGADAVCHQAAMVGLGLGMDDAPDYVSCNDLGTAVLLAGMARARIDRLVLASSMVVYGEGGYACAEHGPVRPGPRQVADLDAGRFEPPCPRCGAPLAATSVTEDAPTDPRNIYAATKLAQEHLAASWARLTGGRAIALRYHNVYGPGMPRDTPYASVAAIFRSALASGAAPRVFEDGRQRRDFIHVDDIARANLAALRAVTHGDGPQPGQLRAYNVGSGYPHTVAEMAEALAGAHRGPAPIITGDYRLGDVRHVTASSERIGRELGWHAQVAFADGVARFAAYQPAGSAARTARLAR